MANGPNKPSANLTKSDPEDHGSMNDAGNDHLPGEDVSALCATIDQLDSCLDNLEQKNNSLNEKLKEFLESMSKETGEKQLPEVEEKGDEDKV